MKDNIFDASPKLDYLGYFRSRLGGAPRPFQIPEGQLQMELLTAGKVWSPRDVPEKELHGQGMVFVHRPGQYTVNQSPADEHYQCLTLRVFLEGEPPPWPRCFPWDPLEALLSFSRQMIHAYHYAQLPGEAILQAALGQIQLQMLSWRERTSSPDLPTNLLEVLRRVEAKPQLEWSVEDMAQVAGLSPSAVFGHFRQKLETSPHQWLMDLRIRLARERLVTSTAPLKSIAADIGYANPESFSRHFKKATGLTPGLYRKTHTLPHFQLY